MSDAEAGPLAGGHVSHLFMTVLDFPRMLSFYRDTLGLHVVFMQSDRCAFLRCARAAGVTIALYAGRTTPMSEHPHWFLVIDVANLEQVVARLRERGVAVGPTQEVPHGLAATFKDPEGNVIEVHEPAGGKS